MIFISIYRQNLHTVGSFRCILSDLHFGPSVAGVLNRLQIGGQIYTRVSIREPQGHKSQFY
jgi:hypothetical protein